MTQERPGALSGLRIIDMATIVAGPAAAKYLGDFGAEVIKVEAPLGDSARRMGWSLPNDEDSFFWKILNRNKKTVIIDLKSSEGLKDMLGLIGSADVLIENMRPGTLERIGLGPEILFERNPRIVVLRLTGFGQTGPYAGRAGFATLAEALSGYAAISGEPDGQPLLPPIAITDEVAGIVGAFAVMVALHHVSQSGEGQVVDVNLVETLLQLMGPLIPAYAHLGYLQPRMGSNLPWSVPRGTYQCADGKWIALSASSDSVAERLLKALGMDRDRRFASARDRMEHREALEKQVRSWVSQYNAEDAVKYLIQCDVAAAPVYTMKDVLSDPHFTAREAITQVDGITMPNVIARLSRTPGVIRCAGRSKGANQDDIAQLTAGKDEFLKADECSVAESSGDRAT